MVQHKSCYPLPNGFLGTEAEVLFMLLLGIRFQEYNVRTNSSGDKNYFIGRFVTGLPGFSKKKNADNKWSLHKEGLQGRQVSDALRVLSSSHLLVDLIVCFNCLELSMF